MAGIIAQVKNCREYLWPWILLSEGLGHLTKKRFLGLRLRGPEEGAFKGSWGVLSFRETRRPYDRTVQFRPGSTSHFAAPAAAVATRPLACALRLFGPTARGVEVSKAM